MKRSFKSTSIKILLTGLIFLTQSVSAKTIAVVKELTGNAFMVKDGKTKELRVGHEVPNFSEVITAEGSQITLRDFHDHLYHLSGSGHVGFISRTLELKRGYLWYQAFSVNEGFQVQTPNSVVSYDRGEGVVSYDSFAEKTQLMVIKGSVQFANSIESNYVESLYDGQFSFIDNTHRMGAPRRPTPVGYSSFQKITGLFRGVERINKDAKRVLEQGAPAKVKSRAIASVPSAEDGGRPPIILEPPPSDIMIEQKKPAPKKIGKGKVTIIRKDYQSERELKKLRLMMAHQKKMDKSTPTKKVVKKFRPAYESESEVEVQIFRPGQMERMPASKKVEPAIENTFKNPVSVYKKLSKMLPKYAKPTVRELPSVTVFKAKGKKAKRKPASVTNTAPADEFESSMLKQYKKQMRHSKEVNSLIKELKSYSNDYLDSY